MQRDLHLPSTSLCMYSSTCTRLHVLACMYSPACTPLQVISAVMGPRFEGKWLMQLSLFPKKKGESGEWESTFETVEEWVPPPPEEAWNSEDDDIEAWEKEVAENEDDG